MLESTKNVTGMLASIGITDYGLTETVGDFLQHNRVVVYAIFVGVAILWEWTKGKWDRHKQESRIRELETELAMYEVERRRASTRRREKQPEVKATPEELPPDVTLRSKGASHRPRDDGTRKLHRD